MSAKEERFSKQPPTAASSTLVLPELACDCHGHIFPSPDLYPTNNETMALAPVEFFLDIHHQLGFGRGVLVQGGAYKFDNQAMLVALDEYPDELRGVALVPSDMPEKELEDLAARNVRALRFTTGGASKFVSFPDIAPRMCALGLHAEMYVALQTFVDNAKTLLATGVPIVLDHLAGPFDPAEGVDSATFQSLLAILRSENIWIKLTPQRNSLEYPTYEDVRPFQDAIIAARPDRVVWGSDWPFPNMSDKTPDIGDLVSLFGDWVTDEGLRKTILVDNAATLYRF
jgi:2-pyrone-4,6-dicarboxylate lactonase